MVQRYETLLDFSSGYLMKKDFDKLESDALPIVKRLVGVAEPQRKSHKDAASIAKLIGWHSSGYLRTNRNDAYIQHELELCNGLLSDIDGKSLDIQQRNAVVIDEYSNLVIAGAGSGKTLTVVGKLKYLVERWGVKPSQILVTSFTRKSVDELAERIERAGIKGVSTKTFHSLGLSVLGSPGVANENELKRCVTKYLSSEIFKDARQTQAYLEFYGCYSFIPDDWSQYENDGERFKKLKSMDLETLKGQLSAAGTIPKTKRETLHGERVKSLEELIIANHLFLYGVKYEYEKNYTGHYDNSGNRAYQPDFYLSDYDIWLEHFGIDEHGRAPWLATEFEEQKYLEGIIWKRKIHKENETTLLESYSYWNQHNQLIDNLDAMLEKIGVKLKLDQTRLAKLYKELTGNMNFNKSMVDLICTFIGLYKANNFTMDIVDEKARAAYANKKKARMLSGDSFMHHRYKLFATFLAPMIDYYTRSLRQKNQIDFDDMINQATAVIQANGIDDRYRYIIVDEYQDISMSRFNLIKAIREHTDAKLICVGDDWQSIYRFAGSDVTLFTSFGEFCGYHERLYIEGTYRNSQSLIDVASRFIMKNEHQIEKRMVSRQKEQNPKPVTVLSVADPLVALKLTLDFILGAEAFSGSVLILGRHNFDFARLFGIDDGEVVAGHKYDIDEFSFKMDKDDDISIVYKGCPNIRFMSVHRAKGLEDDEVIVLNLVNDTYGFPNKVVDDPILNLLLASSDEYSYAEERRLFYVALTRTKNRVFLISSSLGDSKGQSIFVDELLEDSAPGDGAGLGVAKGRDENQRLAAANGLVENQGLAAANGCGEKATSALIVVSQNHERSPLNCPRCGSGVLIVRRNSLDGREFLGCSNYPFCDRTY
ncbi:MAG: UvrD-helicase domain-containing protein, partial [Coriobacteriaceae bacterium]|nr:UvrD-helicase domain-containing protein [Coriobacteriaceae bacterium]